MIYSSYGQLFGCLDRGNLNGRLVSTIYNLGGITINELRAMIAYKRDKNALASTNMVNGETNKDPDIVLLNSGDGDYSPAVNRALK
ncbi:9941_t:CDS:2 [Funneliformis mosseae]|uniref:9941_t:CDS:1 n=1 Tax=Funneliformis mosseae TaxID=27381 RepID=A0A9N9AI79_FUNMO|nr:9941_t:CDS:2 [Funneliformis mosseae]